MALAFLGSVLVPFDTCCWLEGAVLGRSELSGGAVAIGGGGAEESNTKWLAFGCVF